MQPKMISKGRLYITGLTGDGAKTGEVWNDFENRYHEKPFPKVDENGYELRFFNGEKSVAPGKDIHVGFLTDKEILDDRFITITLPIAEYAVFDVYVAKGYDSGNADMNQWLSENLAQYKQLTIDGTEFIVECYNEKFKGGDKKDSIVEIWIPVYRICQSCGMRRHIFDK